MVWRVCLQPSKLPFQTRVGRSAKSAGGAGLEVWGEMRETGSYGLRQLLIRIEAEVVELLGPVRVLDEARAMAEQIGISANSCMFRMRAQPLRLSKQQSPEVAT